VLLHTGRITSFMAVRGRLSFFHIRTQLLCNRWIHCVYDSCVRYWGVPFTRHCARCMNKKVGWNSTSLCFSFSLCPVVSQVWPLLRNTFYSFSPFCPNTSYYFTPELSANLLATLEDTLTLGSHSVNVITDLSSYFPPNLAVISLLAFPEAFPKKSYFLLFS
jgi:hypothetical protein